MTKPVVIVGALDTKGAEFRFAADLITGRGLPVIVVDFGVMGDPPFVPDVPADEVARAGGSSLAELRAGQDKTKAMETMAAGLTKVVKDLYDAGRLGGILGMAGSGGTAIATRAMRGLPIGVPKVMASTVAGGDVAAYVGTTDITMMPTVVDVAGINSISRSIYANAAGAIAGMVQMRDALPEAAEARPLITASMFGNTTACVSRAQKALEAEGYEVLVFHATGTGGKTMESLIASGFAGASLDITTTELADYVCGGVMSAGPERMLAAARAGIPTLLVPGCVDMCNFWGKETVPEKYHDRNLYVWNPNVTLMRTTVAENIRMGEMIAAAANAATGPVTILLPLKGVSQLDSPGNLYWDPAADAACFDTIKANVKPGIPVVEMDCNINDPEFAERAAGLLLEMMKK
ncbi:MAG TPA: Tm-1-like ATP-binding domain-containing protein [Anaerolineae bacterium]